MGVGAVHHRQVAACSLFGGDETCDGIHHVGGFGVVIDGFIQGDLQPLRALGEESLRVRAVLRSITARAALTTVWVER